MRALCQCSLCFLESSRLVYIILASWASMVMNHCEKPDRVADRIATEPHVEEIYAYFIGQPSLWLCCPLFRKKKTGVHFSLILNICFYVFISVMLNKDAHLSILFWLSLPFQDPCVTSLWITEIKELPNAKEKFHKYETLGMFSTSTISFVACAMCMDCQHDVVCGNQCVQEAINLLLSVLCSCKIWERSGILFKHSQLVLICPYGSFACSHKCESTFCMYQHVHPPLTHWVISQLMDLDRLYWSIPFVGKGIHIVLSVLRVKSMVETIRSDLWDLNAWGHVLYFQICRLWVNL